MGGGERGDGESNGIGTGRMGKRIARFSPGRMRAAVAAIGAETGGKGAARAETRDGAWTWMEVG